MALFNPFCKCLNPQRIVNPYTHECMTVPCGKCKACILAKNSRYAFQCDLESYCSMYTVFVTLTYAPNYLPVATPMYLGDNTDFGLLCRYDLVDFETGESLGVFESESSQLELLQQKFNLCGSIPYLRKTDLQLFLKRFRYYVTKRLPKEKVRYYAVCEYGPVHFRPHYHLLLFLNSKEVLQICPEAVSEAWPFGRIDVQVSEGKCSSYVAGYVNSSVFSPTLSLHILRDKEKFIIRELGRASTALPSWMAPPNALRAKRKPQTQRSKRSERSDAELSTDFFIIIFYVSPPMFNLKIFVLWELLQ